MMFNAMKRLLFSLTIFVYLLVVYIMDLRNLSSGYQITVVIPIIYFILFYWLIYDDLVRNRPPFVILVVIISFIRYVILSIATIGANTYSGFSSVQPEDSNLTFAGYLMLWELLAVFVFINLYSKKKSYNRLKENELKIAKTSTASFLFVIGMFFLVIMFPNVTQGISFFSSVNFTKNDELDSNLILLIREILINGKYFFLFGVISFLTYFRINGKKLNSMIVYLIVLFTSVLLIGIRLGSNRKILLLDSFAVIFLLVKLYPKYRKVTIYGIGLLGLSLIIITSISRSLSGTTFDFFKTFYDLKMLQPYFPGQYNIAIAIESKQYFLHLLTPKSYILSLLRPVLGLGSVVKNIDFNFIIEVFAKRMSFGLSYIRHDQIMPMIGQGYVYFGVIFAPTFSVLATYLGLKFQDLFYRTDRIELYFLSLSMMIYLSQFMILNITIITNSLSFKLPIYWFIFHIVTILNKKEVY